MNKLQVATISEGEKKLPAMQKALDCKRKNAGKKPVVSMARTDQETSFEAKGKEFIQQTETVESIWNVADAGIIERKVLRETIPEKM